MTGPAGSGGRRASQGARLPRREAGGASATTDGASHHGTPAPAYGPDSIIGTAGDDTLKGRGDDDQLWGGTGNDALLGGGDESLHGGEGDDLLDGGTGRNIAHGGTGDDVAFVDAEGPTGVVLEGGAGTDHLSVGAVDGDGLAGAVGIDLTAGPATRRVNGAAVATAAGFETLEVVAGGGDDRVRAAGGDVLFVAGGRRGRRGRRRRGLHGGRGPRARRRRGPRHPVRDGRRGPAPRVRRRSGRGRGGLDPLGLRDLQRLRLGKVRSARRGARAGHGGGGRGRRRPERSPGRRHALWRIRAGPAVGRQGRRPALGRRRHGPAPGRGGRGRLPVLGGGRGRGPAAGLRGGRGRRDGGRRDHRGALAAGEPDPARFRVGAAEGQFVLLDAGADERLAWDANGTGAGGATAIAMLSGLPGLTAEDIVLF